VYACHDCVRRFAEILRSRWVFSGASGILNSSAVASACLLNGCIPSKVLGCSTSDRWFMVSVCNANLLLLRNHASCCEGIKRQLEIASLEYVGSGLSVSDEKRRLVPIDKFVQKVGKHCTSCTRRKFSLATSDRVGTVELCSAVKVSVPMEVCVPVELGFILDKRVCYEGLNNEPYNAQICGQILSEIGRLPSPVICLCSDVAIVIDEEVHYSSFLPKPPDKALARYLQCGKRCWDVG